MFWLSKIFWLLFLPSNLILWLLVLGGLFAFFRHRRAAVVCLAPVMVVVVAATILPLGTWLLMPLENRFPRPDLATLKKVDGIIVLGGSIDLRYSRDRGEAGLNGAAERITGMIALARRYPTAAVVFTGGSGDIFDQSRREADGLRRLLEDIGGEPARIKYERESRNTMENARFTRRLVAPSGGSRWLLVTSAAHMPRAMGVFRREGWPVIAYPVDFNTPRRWPWRGAFSLSQGLGRLDAAAKEWVGLAAYRILGYTSTLFPGPAPSLETGRTGE